jgi:hypothetical protein
MPAFVAALLGGLLEISGSLVGSILVQLGIGVVMFTGMDTSLSWLKSQAVGYLQGIGSVSGISVVGLLTVMKVGVAVNIVFSALLARLSLAGFVNGAKRVLR